MNICFVCFCILIGMLLQLDEKHIDESFHDVCCFAFFGASAAHFDDM